MGDGRPPTPPRDEPIRLEGRLALRPVEAAQVLGLSERTLRQILPQIPHLRAGSAVLIPVDSRQQMISPDLLKRLRP